MIVESWIRITIVAAVFIAFLGLERWRSLRRPKLPLSSRWTVNIGMSLLTYLSALLLVQPVSAITLTWTANAGIGILHWFTFPAWASWVVGFLLLDLSFYYWHRLNHVLPIFWRLHNVHHTDPDLDVTTGFRFHFVEVGISAAFRGLQVVAIGAPLAVFVAYEFYFQLATFFHHSNIRLPMRFERFLTWIFVTPRVHGIHHSDYHDETDSNYSVVFSVWDRIHGTFRWGIPDEKINIGVPAYAEAKDNRISALLTMPFEKQRIYWLNRETRR